MAQTIKLYKTYSFRTKDPVIDELRTLVQDQGASYSAIHEVSGVSVNTIYNWFHGKTKKPQSASVEAVGRALGYRRDWVKVNGQSPVKQFIGQKALKARGAKKGS